MVKTHLFFLLIISLSIMACQSGISREEISSPPYRLVAYANDQLHPEHAKMLTHVNFAFANVIEGEVVVESEDSLALMRMHRLKSDNPRLQILLSVGGWAWSKGFSDAALTDSSRHLFARSAIRILKHFRLDGIDIDWEYPALPGNNNPHRPEDKHNYSLLLQTLRHYLDAQARLDKRNPHEPYLLTSATAASQSFLDHTEMDQAIKYLDFVNIMTYDYYGGWSQTTGHHSNLSAPDSSAPSDRCGRKSVAEHLSAGLPAEKLVLGVPFYGRGWRGVDSAKQGLYQAYTGDAFSISYQQIEQLQQQEKGFLRNWDSLAQVPFIWQASTKTFISYEDSESLGIKAAFVQDNKLGGIMFWHYRHDTAGILLNELYQRLGREE